MPVPVPARPPPPRWRGIALNVLKVAVALGLIVWLATSGQIRAETLRQALDRPGAVALSFAAIGTTFIFAILRWWVLLRAIDLVIPLRTAAKLTFIGSFFNTFMPGAVGGDAFKMYYAVENAPPGKKVEAATTVALDRLIGLGAMFILVGVAVAAPVVAGSHDAVVDQVVSALGARLGPLGKPLAAALLVAGVLALGVFHPGVRDWALVRRVRERLPGGSVGGRVIRTFVRTARSPWPIAAAVVLSCAAHLSTVACFFVVGRALGETALGPGRYVLLVPIGLMVNAIPGSPAGIGIGEAAYEKLFEIALGPAGGPSPGADICVIWRLVTLTWNLGGGIVYVLHRRGERDAALVKSGE